MMYFRFPPGRLCAAILCLLALSGGQASAAWFEAQGQAAIINGNRPLAKQLATEDALRQAMLFAGASVSSVQQLTNGLLTNDEFAVSANGEVDTIELTDEIWHDGYVTVKLRADISPQTTYCATAAYQKRLSATYFPIRDRTQAMEGRVHKLSESAVQQLKRSLDGLSDTLSISYIAPYTAQWQDPAVVRQATALARQTKTQYVVAGEILDLSIERTEGSVLKFWQDPVPTRQFALHIEVIDGMNGATMVNREYRTEAEWEFDRFSDVDVGSGSFWKSAYGAAITDLLSNVARDISATLDCQPLTGRVIQVAGDALQISIGREQGLNVGDELSVYQTNQVIDAFGQAFLQYNLYPGKVRVTAAYADTATVEPVEGVVLANIQPNDFVARR